MLKQRKNKTFNYKPKFSEKNGVSDSLNEDSEIDKFSKKWQRARMVNNKRGSKGVSIRMLIIFLVLLLISLYMLDF